MVSIASTRMLQHIGDLDKKSGRVMISREALRWIEQLLARTGGDTDLISAAGTSGISLAYVQRSDPAGVFVAGNPTHDLVIVFNTAAAQTATRTIRGTLNSALGTYTAVSTASTGEETTYAVNGDGSDSVRVDITHTASGAIASASFAAMDLSVAGATPGGGGSGSGGGGPK